MSTCPVCLREFKPKRSEQRLCSVTCRQRNNAKGHAGKRTGPHAEPYIARLTKDGYLRMWAAKHPFADGRREMHVHDMVMESILGRRQYPWEVVHHKDEVKTNNAPTNPELWIRGDHSSHHMKAIVKHKHRNQRGRFA